MFLIGFVVKQRTSYFLNNLTHSDTTKDNGRKPCNYDLDMSLERASDTGPKGYDTTYPHYFRLQEMARKD